MRRFAWLLVGVVALGLLAACATTTSPSPSPNPNPNPTTGSITGTLAMLSGVPGNLNNAQCGLYTSKSDWNTYSPAYTATVVGSGASVTFAFPTIVPFSYYLDCWLDLDLNGIWSLGDIVAVYGTYVGGVASLTPIPVAAGSAVSVQLTAVYY